MKVDEEKAAQRLDAIAVKYDRMLTEDDLEAKALRALKEGMYVVLDGFSRTIAPAEEINLRYSKRNGMSGFFLCFKCYGSSDKVSLDDYGKAWALTKEELQ